MKINLGKQSGTIKLKSFVKDKDITVTELADKAGITRVQASRLMNGSHCGMLVAALRVSKLIDVPVDEVFGYLLKRN